ncbi:MULTISPECIES: cyclic nucleotide-binding domain-containing protein [unclassified Bartonella]|uniref:cyclic nucleotide-binding domain-containing protein n=1 Tax=unclassified Bartonella TaxID=2645622 RepID=UPI001FED650E|nr:MULTISPECIES: cyclic nucleotide-binding domain-containing protein [unclassified Bartonella]UXN04183.1 cyclic nucleotide-binding domain-containing protein [Bartonella sp. HY406]UXN07173.1 cyclic nucleotide-binding domain-containing protein [Bartonella sp. HY761]
MMRPEDIAAVRQLELFANVKEETFQSLINGGFLQNFPEGVVLIHQNQRADFLYILIEGNIEMFSYTEEKQTILDIVEPVGLFILAAVLNDDVCLQSARTLSNATVLMIPAEQVRQAIEEDITFMRAVVRELAKRYRHTVKELKNQKLRSSSERLANFLIKFAKQQNQTHFIDLPCEKRLIARYLGMTAENLSRSFSQLAKHGIKVDGSRVVFVDMHKLELFARPDPLIDKIEPQ